MQPYFHDPAHVALFSAGFDLVRGELPKPRIREIIREIDEELTENPRDHDAILCLDALYDAIGERDAAIRVLARYQDRLKQDSIDPERVNRTQFSLRSARQQMFSGEKKAALLVFDEVIAKVPDAIRYVGLNPKHSPVDSPALPLYSLLAYGYKNDRHGFITAWHAILKRFDLTEPVSEKKFLGDYANYTLFDVLPYRESLDLINFFFQYEIREGREQEIFALSKYLKSYVERMVNDLIEDGIAYGFTEPLPAMDVVTAVARGGVREMEVLLKKYQAVPTKAFLRTIQDNLDKVRKLGTQMLVIQTMTRWCSNPVLPVPEILRVLREQSHRDDLLIADSLDLTCRVLPYNILTKMLSNLSVPAKMKAAIKDNWEMVQSDEIPDHPATSPAIVATNAQTLKLNEDSADRAEIGKLQVSGHATKEFQYLKSCIMEGGMLNEVPRLFELGLCVQPVDLISVLPSLQANRITSGAMILKAYDLLLQKDLDHGLALIEQAQQAGFPRDLASVYAARFLAEAGYPKRVVGLCEKMIKKNVFPQYAYPLLIDAYRALGKEKEAQAAEALAGKIRVT
ncbi:MAG: hypothetical protein STSR0009_04440 [Methanoregula sp.]